jgi:hypothetical protein
MKIFIRHPRTNLYHGGDGKWVEDLSDARRFSSTIDAVKFVMAKQLDAYEVLMKHPTNPDYDIVLLQATGRRQKRTVRPRSGHKKSTT